MAKGDKKNYKAATFRLPPDVLAELDRESRKTGVPKGVLVERALKSRLAKSDVKIPDGKSGSQA